MMPRRPPGPWARLLLAGALLCTAGAAERPDRIAVDFPLESRSAGTEGDLGFISGRIAGGPGARIDVIFVLDVSGSTADSAGIDVDGDGRVRGSADSILAAEVAAVRALLGQLDPRTTRVGVVIFAGDERNRNNDALTQVPLTSRYAEVERGLDEILLVPPEGGTNIAAGLVRARRELFGRDTGRRGAKRHVLLLTDGEPTLPGRQRSREPVDAALRMSRQLAKMRVRIDGFAIGPRAVEKPEAVREASALTRGTFTAVRDIGELSARVGSVRFAPFERIEVRNETVEREAACQILDPDGRFAALVQVRPGTNRFALRAVAARGEPLERRIDLEFAPGQAFETALDGAQRAALARLRQLCLRPDATPGTQPGVDPDRTRPRRDRERRIEIETDDPGDDEAEPSGSP